MTGLVTAKKFYGRVCTVNVYDSENRKTTVENLRISFKVESSLSSTPNTCEIKIYNLTENTRSNFQRTAKHVEVLAGYEGLSGLIFSGDVRTIDHNKSGVDWVTNIRAGDGELPFRFARFKQESFPKGAKVTAVLNRCYALLQPYGISRGNLDVALDTFPRNNNFEQFASGFSPQGLVSTELDSLCRTLGWQWSIQKRALTFTFGDKHTTNTSLVELSPDSGLLQAPNEGAPEKKKGPAITKLVALLNNTLVPGQGVRVKSSLVSGDFKIRKLTHEGDTYGNDWKTELEVSSK